MAEIEEGIVYKLINDPAFKLMFGDRIKDFFPSQLTYPAVRYSRISTPTINTRSGQSLQNPQVQLDIHASGRQAANEGADVICAALIGNPGYMGPDVSASFIVLAGRVSSEDPDTHKKRVILTLSIGVD